MNAFTSYYWPGNVRELQNLVERAVIRSENGVLPNPVPTSDEDPVTVLPTQGTLMDSQRALILRTLAAAGWVIGGPHGAAARLGLKRTTLIAKMKRLGISRPRRPMEIDEFSETQDNECWLQSEIERAEQSSANAMQ
jgi:transcriptional regulator of acetoin/glycerol metabolism